MSRDLKIIRTTRYVQQNRIYLTRYFNDNSTHRSVLLRHTRSSSRYTHTHTCMHAYAVTRKTHVNRGELCTRWPVRYNVMCVAIWKKRACVRVLSMRFPVNGRQNGQNGQRSEPGHRGAIRGRPKKIADNNFTALFGCRNAPAGRGVALAAVVLGGGGGGGDRARRARRPGHKTNTRRTYTLRVLHRCVHNMPMRSAVVRVYGGARSAVPPPHCFVVWVPRPHYRQTTAKSLNTLRARITQVS